MGLKTENYYIKKFDLYLPTAYAKLRTLVLNSDGTINATFSIQQSREHCVNYEAIDSVKITTKKPWDRVTPLEQVAYNAVKTETYTVKDEITDIETEKTDYNALFGWQDDYV